MDKIEIWLMVGDINDHVQIGSYAPSYLTSKTPDGGWHLLLWHLLNIRSYVKCINWKFRPKHLVFKFLFTQQVFDTMIVAFNFIWHLLITAPSWTVKLLSELQCKCASQIIDCQGPPKPKAMWSEIAKAKNEDPKHMQYKLTTLI